MRQIQSDKLKLNFLILISATFRSIGDAAQKAEKMLPSEFYAWKIQYNKWNNKFASQLITLLVLFLLEKYQCNMNFHSNSINKSLFSHFNWFLCIFSFVHVSKCCWLIVCKLNNAIIVCSKTSLFSVLFSWSHF